MPYDESMIFRAAQQAADYLLQGFVKRVEYDPNCNTTGMPKVGAPFVQRCFVAGEDHSLSDIEMIHCDCGMWHAMGHACTCKWLPASSLDEQDDEPVFEAILDTEQETMVPCPCTRIASEAQQKAWGPNFHCSICNGKRLVSKEKK